MGETPAPPPRALRVVCYAVNGTGVGHLTRLLAIARWMRRYAAALGLRLEVWFLTSSEAEGLAFAEGFAAFKIPSKTVVAEAGIDRRTYAALAKQWIWHTLGLLRPDVLVVDTFPRGSFGELLGALDLARRTVFVYRPVRQAVAERADFQAMVRLYDLVLVPEALSLGAPDGREGDGHVIVPPGTRDRLVHVGPVLARERWELVPRAIARQRLGVGDEARCVYVSAGGGGDRGAEAQLDAAVRALSADPSLSVVVGAGPLYRGRPFPGVTTITGRAAEWALAFDAAVSAAGYNAFGELMFAGVPTIFVPQEKLADDQRARAERAVRAGAASMLAPGANVRAALEELLARPDASAAARALVPDNGARVAAAEILRLVCGPRRVDHAEAALDDAPLERASSGGRELVVLGVAADLARGRDEELAAALGRATAILGDRDGREVRGLVDAVACGLPSSSVAERAGVCEEALAALAVLEVGDGAAARAALADGRWGRPGCADGRSLARAMRPEVTGAPR